MSPIKIVSKNQPKLLRERLKECGISLVDLAEFLHISRPTAYKFIQLYESGYKDSIEAKLLNFFDFVMSENTLDKSKAMGYIIENLVQPNNAQSRKQIIANLLKKEDKLKIDFIDTIAQTQALDPILGYLLDCSKILKKGKSLNQKEQDKLAPLSELYGALGLRLDAKSKSNTTKE